MWTYSLAVHVRCIPDILALFLLTHHCDGIDLIKTT